MPNESRSRRSNLINRVPTDAFLDVSPAEQVSIVLELPLSARLPWVRLLPLDDAADLVQAAPDREREGLLGLLDDEARREVRALMAYSEDVAGGLMNPRFMRLRPELTVDEAISYLRKQNRTSAFLSTTDTYWTLNSVYWASYLHSSCFHRLPIKPFAM